MAQFFDDILRDANGHTGTDDFWAPPNTKFDLWSFSLKAAPKKGMNIESGQTNQVDQKDDKQVFSTKTWTKFGFTNDKYKLKYGFAVESEKFAANIQHTLVDDKDWKVTLGANAERKPAKGDWKAVANAAVVSPDMGGVRSYLNFVFEQNNKDETTVTPKINFNYKDFHVGFAAQKVNEAVTKTYAQLAFADKDNLYWLRADTIGQTFGTGCSIEEKNRTHSHELIYNWNKEFKGIYGQPVETRHGGEYNSSDATSLSYTLKLGDTFSLNTEISHKIDSHWTVGLTQEFDGSRKGSNLPMYNVGFKASYKL